LFFIIRLLVAAAGDVLPLLLVGTGSWSIIAISVPFAALSTVAAILLMSGKAAGVTVGKVSMVADAILSLVGAIVGSRTGSDKTGRALLSCLVDVAFFFYLRDSVRVKNTYFRSPNPNDGGPQPD